MKRKALNQPRSPNDLLPRLRAIACFYEVIKTQALASRRVRPDRYAFLSLVNPNHGTSFKHLNHDLRLPRYKLTRTALWLKGKGLIKVKQVSEDRRERRVWLTSDGSELLRNLEVAIEDALARSLPGGPKTKQVRRAKAARLADELVEELKQARLFEED